MIHLLRRTWKYTAALLLRKFEAAADPEIQIEQAIEEGKRQHGLLVQQAAAVIGNQRQIELKLGRTMEQVENLRGSARQALVLGDRARVADEESDAASFDEAAHAFALSLVTKESEMRDLKSLHDRAIDGATAAKAAVEQNAFLLRQRISERTRLLSELEQTKLQERMNEALGSMSDLAPQADVPSFERVRDAIERRYSQALGVAEIGSSAIEVRAISVERATLDAEAAHVLADLRLSLRDAERTPPVAG